MIAGGLLQDLEERLRRDLAPIEERVRPGEERRGVVGQSSGESGGSVVIVLPPSTDEAANPDAIDSEDPR